MKVYTSVSSEDSSEDGEMSLKIPKGNPNPYIEEEQTTQWSKETVQKDNDQQNRI